MRFGRKYDGLLKRWFAWRPVRVGDSTWAWLEWVWKLPNDRKSPRYGFGEVRGKLPSER